MWNEILGALAILGMVVTCVVLIPVIPKLTDAIYDRIRYGVQNAAEHEACETAQEQAAPAAPATSAAAPPQRSTKPVAAAPSTTTPTAAAKPASRVRGTAAAV